MYVLRTGKYMYTFVMQRMVICQLHAIKIHVIMLACELNHMLHVNMVTLHVGIDKSCVNIIPCILDHVDIIQ